MTPPRVVALNTRCYKGLHRRSYGLSTANVSEGVPAVVPPGGAHQAEEPAGAPHARWLAAVTWHTADWVRILVEVLRLVLAAASGAVGGVAVG